MTRMLKADVQKLLGPYCETISKCIEQAWNDYLTEYSDKVKAIHTSRTKANIINDHMVSRAHRELLGLQGVRPIKWRGGVCFLIENKVIMRFKKLVKQGLARNYATPNAKRFADNQLQMDGLPDHAIRVNAGYITNQLQTLIKRIVIACPRSLREVEYVFDISFEPQISELQLPEITPQPSETVVLPKRDTMETEKYGASGKSQDGDPR